MSLQGIDPERLFKRIALTPWLHESHKKWIEARLASLEVEEGKEKAEQYREAYSKAELEYIERQEEAAKKQKELEEKEAEKVKKVVVVEEKKTFGPEVVKEEEKPKKRGRPKKSSQSK